LASAKIVPHIFPTSYAAVDRDLPKLIARHKPDALLMFGLAPRARALRVETCAHNVVSLLPDASGIALRHLTIAAGGPQALAMPVLARCLLAAVRAAGVPATLSRDAGRYLCNYLAWRAAEAADKKGGPHLAGFVHVPNIACHARRPGKRRKLTLGDLTRAGSNLLAAVACHV
jgi:pyroglutamyl-peptidase